MSARSKDLISATLISAGIVCAADVYMAATSGAFHDYWQDWFDNSLWFNSTNAISQAEAAMTEDQGDVLLVSPGEHVISTNLDWTKGNTHLIGAAAHSHRSQKVTIRPAGAAVTDLVTMNATGCVFAGFRLLNAAVTASTACVRTFVSTSRSIGGIVRNVFLHGPEDDTVNDATGGWRMIDHSGKGMLYEDCQIGYAYPMAGEPASPDNYPTFLYLQKSIFNDSKWRNCVFVGEFKNSAHAPIIVEYAPANAVYWTFHNCQFINLGSTACAQGIISNLGGANAAFTGSKNCMFFDSDCAFYGVTDVCAALNESYIAFPSAGPVSTGAAPNVFIGLAQNPDHTS